MNRSFHIGDLISVVDGHLVSPDHMDGIYSVCNYVTGEAHMSHQLDRAADEITPWLLEQHPWLAEITVPDNLRGEDDVRDWLAPVVERYGERHDVAPLPFGAYVGREPIAEFREMTAQVEVDPEANP